jgi:hypothetical protein
LALEKELQPALEPEQVSDRYRDQHIYPNQYANQHTHRDQHIYPNQYANQNTHRDQHIYLNQYAD